MMDKKTKKRIQVLKEKLQHRRAQLASAKKQPDEPQAIKKLEAEINQFETELQQYQAS